MKRTASLVINAKAFSAVPGDTLLDAAMGAGIFIPHDCSSGQCDTCRVRIYDGSVDDRGTRRGDTVLACQARVVSDAVIEFDAVPEPIKVPATLTGIKPISPEILELSIGLHRSLPFLPGQYVKCSFSGFPERDYSPTQRVDGTGAIDELIVHVRRLRDGVVSSRLGTGIRIGHKVTVHGPFGSAFHRMGEGRIVLVATGTGWAPVWAIARASRFRQPSREMVVVAGARAIEDLYMRDSLAWLADTGVRTAIATASGLSSRDSNAVMAGRVTDHLPIFSSEDTVYAAGNPSMVAAVQALCQAAGAKCHSDPFTASQAKPSIGRRLLSFLGRGDAAGPDPRPAAGPHT
ncbi:2Fe-2S iron-sulfur cluster-binding protein [Bosea vestrisii]|uniref:2Fe-2S iron-sulfur cluster-binding protein n=1 Tax=Bosea vestrisii TaxID=151416 RepID=UPI0024DFEF87|nr:2Fe-2S iron-sulfur cluster-binding protein [Bosea vestrisii]WID94872.1 2Fe-2S iron-sulfur cluster-binding protein [Bosea vestrisii]